jgi:RNA polymerase sigma-70 factor, ECF subfamily
VLNEKGVARRRAAVIKHINGLYSYALVLTRNHAEAENLVHETYVRAIQAMGRLRADRNVKSWLFTILRNLWLNQLRERKSGLHVSDLDVDDDPGAEIIRPSKDRQETYRRNTEAKRVRAAIQKLPAEFREVILLREYGELSYWEIARVLDCPAGTVMLRLRRARNKLRMLLLTSQRPEPSRGGEAK